MKRKAVISILIVIAAIGVFALWRHNSRNYNRVLGDKEIIETPETIKIATYNIKTLNQGEDLHACVQDLKTAQADILVLQEVDESAFRSNEMEMVKELAAAADYPYYYFYETMWMVDGYYGLGLLSRYPILSVSSHSLPNELLKEPRILAGAKIQAGEEILSVYLTHLSYKERDVRWEQIDYLKEELQNERNTILMGDFNTFTADDFFTIDGYEQINNAATPLLTFRDFGFPDNIFYADHFTLLDKGTLQSSFSDHNLLWCQLKIQPS